MDSFGSSSTNEYSDGLSHASAYTFGFSSTNSISASGPPFPNDVSNSGDGCTKRIARNLFTAELFDLVTTLRNCGALRTSAECIWCVEELWRILAEPSPGELT